MFCLFICVLCAIPVFLILQWLKPFRVIRYVISVQNPHCKLKAICLTRWGDLLLANYEIQPRRKNPVAHWFAHFNPVKTHFQHGMIAKSQLTHVGFLKRTVFDVKEALNAVIPWPSSFHDASLSDLIQMRKVLLCSSNKTNIIRKFWFNTVVPQLSKCLKFEAVRGGGEGLSWSNDLNLNKEI